MPFEPQDLVKSCLSLNLSLFYLLRKSPLMMEICWKDLDDCVSQAKQLHRLETILWKSKASWETGDESRTEVEPSV